MVSGVSNDQTIKIASKTCHRAGRSQLPVTCIPVIFATGDVRDKSTKQVISAAGEGGSAALMIREYLKGM